MVKVIFNKMVKYNGTKYPQGAAFEVEDKDKDALLAEGGHEIVEAEKGQVPQKGLGNVNPPKEGPYAKFNKDKFIEELTSRGIDQAGLTNNELREKALVEDDAAKLELAKVAAQELEDAKKEALEAGVLEADITDEDTVETLQAKIDALV